MATNLYPLGTPAPSGGYSPVYGQVNVVPASGATQVLPSPEEFPENDITLTADCIFTLPTGMPGSATVVAILRQNDTGGWDFDVSTETPVDWEGNVKPTIDQTAGAFSVVTFYTTNGGLNYIGVGPQPAGSGGSYDINTEFSGKGQFLVGTAAGAHELLDSSGVDGDTLIVDSSQPGGWRVATPSGGGGASGPVPGQVLTRAGYSRTGAVSDATVTGSTYVDVAASAMAAQTSATPPVADPWPTVTATTFDATFTVPASGKVTVRAGGLLKSSSSGGNTRFGLYDVTAAAIVTGSQTTMQTGTQQTRCYFDQIFTGLTPGATLTWRLQWSANGTNTGTLSAGGTNGPVFLEVRAA